MGHSSPRRPVSRRRFLSLTLLTGAAVSGTALLRRVAASRQPRPRPRSQPRPRSRPRLPSPLKPQSQRPQPVTPIAGPGPGGWQSERRPAPAAQARLEPARPSRRQAGSTKPDAGPGAWRHPGQVHRSGAAGAPTRSGRTPRSASTIYEPLAYYSASPTRRSSGSPRATLQPDYKQLTVKTRSGIKWSDGQPFSAEDVAYTLNKLNELGAKVKWGKDVQDVLKDAKATDANTVVINFKCPSPRFFYHMSPTSTTSACTSCRSTSSRARTGRRSPTSTSPRAGRSRRAPGRSCRSRRRRR